MNLAVYCRSVVGRSGAWSTHMHPVWLESDAKHCDLCVRSTLGLGRSGGRVVDVQHLRQTPLDKSDLPEAL